MASISYFTIAFIMMAMICVVTSQYCIPRCRPQPRCPPCRGIICRPGQVRKPRASACGCCPMCIFPIGQSGRCSTFNPRDPPNRQCGYGLCCHPRLGRCVRV